jgi:hypothetical protein
MFLRNGFVNALLAFTFVLTTGAIAQSAQVSCPHPWIFFDLGGTLIDTKTNNYAPMFAMTGATDYMAQLKAEGYFTGLITDVPGSWGRDNAEVSAIVDYQTAKVLRTKYFIEARYPEDKVSWQGPVFDWSSFGEFKGQGPQVQFQGRIVLPQTDKERKSSGNLIMFQRAYAMAAQAGCDALYMGEEEVQMRMAEKAGLVPFRVGSSLPNTFYLPVEQIDTYVKAHRSSHR